MSDLIAHRGPDDQGFYINGRIGLAHRRLSIIDLTRAAQQPMSNEDDTIWIVYNGECYNYLDLRKDLLSKGHRFKSNTDAEVLLHMYEEYGKDFLHKINGMFAFSIWDEQNQRLFIARDRIGIKPLFYYLDRDRLLFASELKALLADPELPRELNAGALSQFFKFTSIPGHQSILKDVKKLSPGHYLVIKDGRVDITRYWDITDFDPKNVNGFKAVCKSFDQRFEQTVKSHLIADVPVGMFLSGGADSSTVLVMMNRSNECPVHTFSTTFTGFEEYDESLFASKVAGLFKTHYREFFLKPDLITALPRIVWHADEPLAALSAIPLYFLSELASRHLKVVLTGDGADEVFAGYPWRHGKRFRFPFFLTKWILPLFSEVDRLNFLKHPGAAFYHRYHYTLMRLISDPPEAYNRSFFCFRPYALARILEDDVIQDIMSTEIDPIINTFFNRPQHASELSRKLYAEIKTTLVSEMLTKVDRMTMAFGLEARVPFLDHHLVEWAFSLPDHYKIINGEGKYVIKKAMENDLPSDILYRRKHGFNLPFNHWIRKELKEFVTDILLSEKHRKRGLFRPFAVAKLLKQHMNGSHDHAVQIYSLLVLELWFQQFMDKTITYPSTDDEIDLLPSNTRK